MADLVYFYETPEGYVYVGATGNGRQRGRSHELDGKHFLAARPGSGKATGTDEDKIQKFFAADLVPGRGRSTFRSGRIMEYVEWLIWRGYAVTDKDEAAKLPLVPFSAWHPGRTGEAFVEADGQMLLVPFVPGRSRIEYASTYSHLMSMTDQWLTPPAVIDLARQTLGTIDTDPASCYKANTWIDARIWYSVDVDGLERAHPWQGTVWLNPPYGRGDHSASAFVSRLLDEMAAGQVTAAVTCLNVNSTCSLWFDQVWANARLHLIWRGRVDFITPTEEEGGSPSKGTIFSYFGPRPERFAQVFGPSGTLVGCHA
jgi:hypothetical protein